MQSEILSPPKGIKCGEDIPIEEALDTTFFIGEIRQVLTNARSAEECLFPKNKYEQLKKATSSSTK